MIHDGAAARALVVDDDEALLRVHARALVKAGYQVVVTAEGIETVEERDELAKAGCDLMQGYLFAKPGTAFPTPSF